MADAGALAQIPTSTAGEMGQWLTGLAAVVGIVVLLLTGANQWRHLTRKRRTRPPGQQFVTRDDMRALELRIDRHEKYTRRRMHEIGGVVQKVEVQLAAQPHQVRQMIDAAVAPISRKVDTVAVAVVAVSVKLGVSVPHPEDPPQLVT